MSGGNRFGGRVFWEEIFLVASETVVLSEGGSGIGGGGYVFMGSALPNL